MSDEILNLVYQKYHENSAQVRMLDKAYEKYNTSRNLIPGQLARKKRHSYTLTNKYSAVQKMETILYVFFCLECYSILSIVWKILKQF
jgi:hypothetical protein